MISALPLAILGPFRQGHVPTVNVRDEAGIFDAQALQRDLQSLRFRQDIRFEVVSLTGWGINNLDAATANYAENIFDYQQDFRTSGGVAGKKEWLSSRWPLTRTRWPSTPAQTCH